MDIATFRAQYPEYDDIPDDVLLTKLQAKFGAQGPPLKEPVSFLGGLGRTMRQGGTFGWGDEIVAGLGALGAGAPGSERYGQAFDRIRRAEDQATEQFSEEYPLTAIGGNIAGGMATGSGAAKAIGKFLPAVGQALSQVPNAVKALVGGGLGGALGGAGENAENRVGGAITGGATGMVAGGATQLVAKYGGEFIDWLRRKVFTGPLKESKQKVFEALQREGLTPADAEAMMQAYGPDAVLADVGGRVRGLAAGVEALPEAPRGQYERMLRERHAAQQGQFMDTVQQATGRSGLTRSYQQHLEDTRKGVTKPLYESARKTPTPLTPVLEDALSLPDVRKAYARGHRAAENEAGRVLPRTSWNAETFTWDNPPTTEEWDWIQRGLRQDYDRAIRSGGKDVARPIAMLRSKILEELDAANPAFAAARRVHATGKQIEDALESGKGFFREKDDELLAATFADMSNPEKGAYLNGVVGAIRQRVRSIGENRDLAVQSWLRSPDFRDRMVVLFGQDAADDIFKQLDILGEKAITKNQLLHQSMTADKTAIREMLQGSDMSSAMRQALGGDLLGAADAARRAITTRPNVDPRTAEELAKMLLTPRSQWSEPLAQQLQGGQLSPFWQRRQQGVVPEWLPLVMGNLSGMASQ